MSDIVLNLHFVSGYAKEVERSNARILFKKKGKKTIAIFYIWTSNKGGMGVIGRSGIVLQGREK